MRRQILSTPLLKARSLALIRFPSCNERSQEGLMRGLEFELDRLLNPAAVFNHPRDVLSDPDLTSQEKRAILSSWASDACAVDSSPTLRRPPGAQAPVAFEDIVDALRALDGEPTPPRPGGAPMRLQRPRRRGGSERSGAAFS